MILTITVNPSVDYLYSTSKFQSGTLNRVTLEKKMVGGKGINAARVSSLLSTDSVATGFIAGKNGIFIDQQAKHDLYKPAFIQINGETRNCFTIIDDYANKTEINEYGAPVSNENFTSLLSFIKVTLKKNQITTISINGSLAPNMKTDSYEKIIEVIKEIDSNVNIILDCNGENLRTVIESDIKPDYIKPNEHELAAFFNREISTNPFEIRKEILNSKLSHIPNIFVSLGSKGALVKHYKDFFIARIPPIKVINTEGSGDSMVGGILAALDARGDIKQQINFAVSAGSANAMETKTGFINIKKFINLLKMVKIKKLGSGY